MHITNYERQPINAHLDFSVVMLTFDSRRTTSELEIKMLDGLHLIKCIILYFSYNNSVHRG